MPIPRDTRSGRIQIKSGGANIGGIRPARSPGTPNYSGLSSGFEAVGQAADSIAQFGFEELNRQQKQRGRREGRKAGGERDAEGNPVPLTGTEGMDTSTAFGSAFVESATQAYSEQVRIDARAKANELAAKHTGDPEGFSESYGAWVDETLGGTDENVREVVEPDLQAHMRLGVSNRMVERVNADRENTVQTLNQGWTDMTDEALGLIRAGKGDDPRVQQLIEEGENYWTNAVQNGLVNEAEAERMKAGFKDARTMTAAMTEIRAAVDAGEFKAARSMIDGLKEDAPDLGLSVKQTQEIEKAGEGYLAEAERERAQAKREAEAAQRKTQAKNYYELQKRIADGDRLSRAEVDRMVEAEEISVAQGGHIYGNVASQREAEQLQAKKEISAELLTDYKTGKLDFAKLREAREGGVMTQSAWLQAREMNYERERKAAERGVDRWIAETNGALQQGEPAMEPDTYRRVLMEQAAKGKISYDSVESEAASYANDFEGWRDEQVTTRSMMRQLNRGGIAGTDERKRFEELFAAELQPLEAGADVTADAVSQAGYLPKGLKRQFQQIDTLDEQSGAVMLDTFQRIRAADPNGSTQAMLQDELGASTYRKLETLARVAPQSESWNEAVSLANKSADTGGSYTRNLQKHMQAEDPEDAYAKLQRGVEQIGNMTLGRGRGMFDRIMDTIIPVYDDRLTSFIREAESYGLSLEGEKLPQAVIDDAAKNARDLLGTEMATDPREAMEQGLARSLRVWGPERVGDEVRWTKNPISWHANRNNEMVPGFEVQQTELQQDFRYQMRAGGKTAPGNSNWDDINLRFDSIPGADDEWQVWYEEPDQKNSWRPLTYKDEDGQDTAITYSYQWEVGKNDKGIDPSTPVSLHNHLYQAALDGKESSRLAASVKDLGVKFLTRWAAKIDVNRVIERRRSQREWERFWADPTVQDTKQFLDKTPFTLKSLREKLEQTGNDLVDALVEAERQE